MLILQRTHGVLRFHDVGDKKISLNSCYMF